MNGPKASHSRSFSPLSAPAAALPAGKSSSKSAVAVAVIAHVLIVGLLSVQWTAGKRTFENPPMEVDLVAETAPTSTAPVITEEAPATRLGDEDERAIEAPEPTPTPPEPTPVPPTPRPTPPQPKPTPPRKAPVEAPAPKQVPKPTPRTSPPAATKAPAKPAPATKAAPAPASKSAAPKQASPTPKATPKQPATGARPTGRLDGIVDGLAKGPSRSTQTKGAPAAATAAEVKRSIDVAIDGSILPFWRRNVPSGVDIDKLRVVLRISLSKDGRVNNITQLGALTGQTDSNAPQQALFVERAMRSIRQAAPFDLPEEHYDQWKVWDVTFRAKGM
jgi:protein TonB